ncbi:Pyrrolidone-carboxylate peptidase [Fusobacterium sp. DD29]|uniref:pyroglutamyl-peptidase I n=1 Tax=unclassified Fusobacterium TaxID=2648384 RepID=UPI001B8C4578|nr:MULTISPECIES: pyroglutamyl-peptidase I [unclassified Fusobacterium]MBR8700748.1 Pyrrolidone-carboxylate peptidase [Fusobacterium sp. DD45]MBR8710527.1 Pyrrolidone-carboxylate peptidase [Fusobacterium sp. DD28]MBR8749116.1 Pyrrolidone-carboxylate peptidase [Fusobacterium sp. DD29]MBR8751123.1 Pyrrolidone-carboxylate peptidase [Fusobacterium sp. DD26]MBR8761382.1 Pyrrolidone-carboxylate peptidase [Fusobacterium sp. DD25]
MKIVITGFDPFGGEKINPAWEAVKSLPDKIGDIEVVKVQVPTVFKKSAKKLFEAIDREKPDAVVCVGQAGGRFDITVERVGINIEDGRIPDNEGYQPIDTAIFEDGENAYFATLPIKAMVDEMKKENIPASVSNSAGTYVCNHLMYSLLYYLDKQGLYEVRGGFIHVPFIPEQVVDKKNMPSMELSRITRGLEIALKAIAEHRVDKV